MKLPPMDPGRPVFAVSTCRSSTTAILHLILRNCLSLSSISRISTCREPGETNSFEDHVNGVEQPLPAPDAPMVEFALDYARRGWPVFPCMPTNKAPYIKGGLNAATTDEKRSATGGRWPQAMIGVPMGSWSGLWAIDPDPPKKEDEPDGREIWAELLEEHGELPPTHTEITPRGGWHILFKWDPDRPVTNSPGALAGPNIDVRGQGGYVIMAPSICVGDGKKNVAGQYRAPLISSSSPQRRTGSTNSVLATSRSRSPRQAQAAPRSSTSGTTTANRSGARSTTWRSRTSALGCRMLFGSAAIYQPGPVPGGYLQIGNSVGSRGGPVDPPERRQGLGRLGYWRPRRASAAPSTS